MRAALLVLAFAIPGSFVSRAHAEPAASARVAYQHEVSDHYRRVVRSTLPKKSADRVAMLKQAMEDEIHSVGPFVTHSGRNPAFEIVHRGANGEHQMTEVQSASGDQTWAKYEVPASALKNGKLAATLLLPVSGHVSAGHTEQFRQSNQYNIVVNGKAMPKVAADGHYVREHDTELALDKGNNRLELWPDGSGGVAGTPGGRVIEINVK